MSAFKILETKMALPETMSGVALIGIGGPKMLAWRDNLPVPTPSENDVIVRVKAAGVNNTEINTSNGWYSKGDSSPDDAAWTGSPPTFPRIQGADVCGEIVVVGTAVVPARIGERILTEPCLREVNGKTLETPWYFGSKCDGGFA